jgi:kinesin family protein C2/C3
VFEEVRPLIRSCADGYNVCIFAYGQTGSGKTHTMEGPSDDPGINRRALQELFSIAAEEVDATWSFSVAVLEIYNEAVHDLLAMAAAGLGSSNGGTSAADLSRFTVDVSGLAAGELPQNMDR